jgi:hypothetical protein
VIKASLNFGIPQSHFLSEGTWWIHRDGDITDIFGGKINGDLEISL